MLPRLVLSSVLIVGLMAPPVWAGEDAPPPAAAPVEAAPASAVAPTDAAAAPAGVPAAQASETGLTSEIANRLAAGGAALSAADREDRAALAAFYAGREQQPVWVGTSGLTPAGESMAAEIRRADDWGLVASAFPLPALTAGGELSRTARADAEIALSLAVLKYARHARGSRADPATLSRNLDRKPPLLPPQAPVGDHGRAGGGGSAISVTRYGDEAYDFRDVRALARFGVNPGADGGWPQFLGAGMLCPECHQDNPPVRKFCSLCGVSVRPSWPRQSRSAWRPSVLVRQWAGQSRTSIFWAACCRC
jgi:hypothetical protein